MEIPQARFDHILVALDGSERAEAVIPHVATLARQFNARVTALCVTIAASSIYTEAALDTTHFMPMAGGTPGVDMTAIADINRREMSDYLRGLEERLRHQGLSVQGEVCEGLPADMIVERARDLRVDLIAMTTHGRSGVRRLMFGSVSEKVLRHAPCPVLLVRIGHENLDDI